MPFRKGPDRLSEAIFRGPGGVFELHCRGETRGVALQTGSCRVLDRLRKEGFPYRRGDRFLGRRPEEMLAAPPGNLAPLRARAQTVADFLASMPPDTPAAARATKRTREEAA